MRPLCWKLGLTGAIGIVLGALGGQATIAGIAPPIAVTPIGRADTIQSAGTRGADPMPADYAHIVDACDNCSDYDLGYRFAAARRLRTTAECMDYSWSYQRGCLAYLRDG